MSRSSVSVKDRERTECAIEPVSWRWGRRRSASTAWAIGWIFHAGVSIASTLTWGVIPIVGMGDCVVREEPARSPTRDVLDPKYSSGSASPSPGGFESPPALTRYLGSISRGAHGGESQEAAKWSRVRMSRSSQRFPARASSPGYRTRRDSGARRGNRRPVIP